jgi:hypothetical protein
MSSETAWKPIETLNMPVGKCFLVRGWFAESNYQTDPWVVFLNGEGRFAKWPHNKPPTEWTEIPE